MGKKKKNENLVMKGDNGLIAELAEVKWVKQPVIYTLLSGDFSLMQMNIIIGISNELQDRINDYLNRRKRGEKGQLSLFTQEEIDKEAITFKINFSSLNIRPDAYDELDQACKNLIGLNMSYPIYQEGTTKIKERAYINLFNRVVVPTNLDDVNNSKTYNYKNGKRRKGWIEITMLTKNLSDVFDMSKGYVNHIATIAQICSKKRTPRIYIYLQRWKNYGSKTVNFLEFKEYLGLITWDRKNDIIKDDVYPKYSVFCANVLEPVRLEMKQLSESNLIDISFDYEPIYKNGRKRGNPDEMKFIIHLSSMGKMITQKSKVNKELSDIIEYLKKEYTICDNDLSFITESFTDSMLPLLKQEVTTLKEKELRYRPTNRTGYILMCLKNFVERFKSQHVVEDAVVIEESKSEKDTNKVTDELPKPTNEDLENFSKVLESIRTQVPDAMVFNFIKLYSVDRTTSNHVKLKFVVPTNFYCEEIETKYLEVFREKLFEYFPGCYVNYVIDGSFFK